MSSEGRRAQIDRRFDETFAVFDERMRKEQETISQERASSSGSASSGAGTGGESESGSGGESGEAGTSDSGEASETDTGYPGVPGGRGESAGQQPGEQGGGGGVGGGATGGSGPNTVPADIPDGRDDDIVARQLREAAMKETDPELRERLWEEYRQYKKSTT
ncbi:MAG TPA: hypothetical protein VLH36_14650 [Steroidobacteraceae bacterium]|jgi:hypothetical protein|nr:hypothetical protein [Steroidobacteraceae bacterium]